MLANSALCKITYTLPDQQQEDTGSRLCNMELSEKTRHRITKHRDDDKKQTKRQHKNNQQYPQPPPPKQIQKSINVMPGMTTHQIAQLVGSDLGCGYLQEIQNQISSQIKAIMLKGYHVKDGSTLTSPQQIVWKAQMQKVLNSSSKYYNIKQQITSQDHQIIPTTHEKKQKVKDIVALSKSTSSKYFQINYDKIIKSKSQKELKNNQGTKTPINEYIQEYKNNKNAIYERSMQKKKQTQHKLKMIKRKKHNQEVYECTFSPNISSTIQFYNQTKRNKSKSKTKNPPPCHNQSQQNQARGQNQNLINIKNQCHKYYEKQNTKDNAFERLYKHSFDLLQKKKQRVRTLENQQQIKLSELPFAPLINQCSREICKIKSYGSIISDLSQPIQKQKDGQKPKLQEKDLNKVLDKQQTAKKSIKKIQKYHPQISKNTGKLIKDMSFSDQRYQNSKQKCVKNKVNELKLHNKQNSKVKYVVVSDYQRPQHYRKVKLKKQTYTIQDEVINKGEIQKKLQIQEKKKQKPRLLTEPEQQKTQKKQKNQQKKNIQNRENLLKQRHTTEYSLSNYLIDSEDDKQKQISKQKQKQKEKRSHQLFRNRKKIIFETIFIFLTTKPYVPTSQFCRSKKVGKLINWHKLSQAQKKANGQLMQKLQVSKQCIIQNPFIPTAIKQLLSPLSEELSQLEIRLSKQQFIWAIQRLFQQLSFPDRGSLLGWGVKLLPQQDNS